MLAIDIGNTNTVIGWYDGAQLRRHWRVLTQPARTADEYGFLIGNLLRAQTGAAVSGVAVSSVVPAMSTTIATVCRDYLHATPLFVGPGVKTGMPILYDDPRQLGSDRIVNAVAAYERTHAATIVVDLGTATKLEYISAAGEYVGGVIAPGVGISSDALFARAARLSRVALGQPAQVVGRNTVAAVQSGLFYGYVAMIDGLVARIRNESGSAARVIATGGFAPLLAPASATIEIVDEFLTLDGIRLIFDRNRPH
ncbi:MAG TPA: type III pantothenate kinase [Candidatus Kryptonia bacterium]|nr:type III pantothenate kinase [Candidatus Kryptonia bacterium]